MLKMAVFWVVAPSKHLWNVGKLLPDYTAQQPRKKPSSNKPPWEHKISIKIREQNDKT
jgi:hypothetical protein